MRNWLRAGRLLSGLGWEIGPAVFLLYAGVSAVAFLAPLLLALGLRPLVDGIAAHSGRQVTAGAVPAAVALLLTVSAPIAYRWATIRMRERSVMVVQRRLLRLAAGTPGVELFERPSFADRLQLLKAGADDLVSGMSVVFIGPIVTAQLVVTGAVLARLEPVLLLVPVVAIPAALLSRRGERLRRAAELRVAESQRTAQDLFTLAATAAAGPDIRIYGLRTELLERHRRASRTAQRGVEGALWRSAAIGGCGWLLFGAAYAGAAILVLREAAGGRGTAGDVALTLGLASAMVAAAARLGDLAGSVLRVLTAAGHYRWLSDQARAAPGTAAAPERLTDGITVEGVSFGYAGAGRAALSDVTLRLPAGAVVAVVGENGAGKTTLVKLLCGLYRPGAGRIRLDGVDLSTMDLDGYRERIAAGFQDYVRFELPVAEAVGLGDLRRLGDLDAVRAALDRAGAGFVHRLPHGLDTPLGLSWQDGVDLSGGEWQKLALARSMMRTGPLLYVLDEPTASLDPQAEHLLFEQIAAAASAGAADGRITVLISHRFSTVRMAGLIVVLGDGRVREAGTHDELMAAHGLYAQLYTLQADAYR
jgi:ATP-binding cassette subfamily B protein